MNVTVRAVNIVIPALSRNPEIVNWIPAFAGMTNGADITKFGSLVVECSITTEIAKKKHFC
jgi:hypothetical protein